MGDGTEPDPLHEAVGEALRKGAEEQRRAQAEYYRKYIGQQPPIARDLFAAHAMQAILMRISPRDFQTDAVKPFLRDAFAVADYMMEVRDGGE